MTGAGLMLRFGLLLPATLLILVAATFLGQNPISWQDLTAISWHDLFSYDHPTNVYWHLRVPRALLAACAGAGLAIGGVIFQAIFRNPLAEPYTLGIASGASLAAAVGFFTGLGGYAAGGIPVLSLLAFCGAVAAMGGVFLISRLRPHTDMARLLLAGVCIAYMCSAGILLVTFLADRAITNDIVIWMMGSLGRLHGRAWFEILVILVPVLAFAAARHRALDLLCFGPHVAATRGVAVDTTIWLSFALVGLLTAVIVANCGPIGFVGLMVPHIGRAVFGIRTLPLLGGAALIGAGFLALCDGLARSYPMVELPVGVVTNILGAAFFFYMLATRDIAHTAVRR